MNRRQTLLLMFLWLLIAALAVLSGCSGHTAADQVAARSPLPPTPSPTMTLAPPYQATAQSVEVRTRATLAAGQVLQQQVGLTATAVHLQMQQAAATQNAFFTATAQVAAWTATARAEESRATATARAEEMRATATARAEATQAAIMQATATAQAVALQGTATAQSIALLGTATAQAFEAQATTQAMHAQATALAAEALRVDAQARREAAMAGAWAIGKFAVTVIGILVALALGVWLAVQAEAYRVVRAARGERVLLKLGKGYVDPDRNMHPVVLLGPDGRPKALPTAPDAQERTTARAQAVQLAQALPPRRAAARRALQKAAPPRDGDGHSLAFRVLDPAEARRTLPGLVDPQALRVLDAEWREAPPNGGAP